MTTLKKTLIIGGLILLAVFLVSCGHQPPGKGLSDQFNYYETRLK